MAIDARIALGVQPPQFESPVNALAKVMQIKGLQQDQQLGQMKMQEYERGVQEQNALRSVLGGQGFDWSNADMRNRAMAASPAKATEMYKAHVEATDKAGQTKDREFKQAQEGYKLANQRLAAWRDRQDLTKQGLVADMGALVTWGLMRPEALKMFDSLPDDPNVLRAEIDKGLKSGLTSEQVLTLFAPKPTEVKDGKTLSYRDTNPNSPTYGQMTAGGVVQMQTTPDADLSAATSTANNQRSVGAQYANAAATRDIAAATREASLTEKNLKIEEMRDKRDERGRAKAGSIASIESQIGVLDKALTHPGRETATGLSGSIDPRNYVPGTNASDFRAVLDQISGTAFLQAFESLKGGGQITEVEGKKATDAIARLNRAQSDKEFKVALEDLRGVMTAGYKRLAGKDYPTAAPSEAKPAAAKPAAGAPRRINNDEEYNALPKGAEYIAPDGKTRRKQ